jgi:hypothetical protein
MFRLKYFVATCVLALTIGTANADTVTFDASGTFATTPGLTLAGTITVDLTAKSITAVDFIINGLNNEFAPFTTVLGYNKDYAPTLQQLILGDGVDNLTLYILDHQGGGTGCSNDFGCGVHVGVIQDGFTQKAVLGDCVGCDFNGGLSGTLTPEVATTPLPAALPLFATGLGALGLLGWRRKRKNAAALAA